MSLWPGYKNQLLEEASWRRSVSPTFPILNYYQDDLHDHSTSNKADEIASASPPEGNFENEFENDAASLYSCTPEVASEGNSVPQWSEDASVPTQSHRQKLLQTLISWSLIASILVCTALLVIGLVRLHATRSSDDDMDSGPPAFELEEEDDDTSEPSPAPTLDSISRHTPVPSHIPTRSPIILPSFAPSKSIWPSLVPTLTPSAGPSLVPTRSPWPSFSQAPSKQPSLAPSLTPTRYCFPQDFVEYTSVWDQNFTIHVKESADEDQLCGPRLNRFVSSNVELVRSNDNNETALAFNTDALILRFVNQTASEVSILLPLNDQVYTYGSFSFSVHSVMVYNLNGTVASQTLPPELVLGLFTYAGGSGADHLTHEVDIEISQWNEAGSPDVHFVLQGSRQKYQFYSGNESLPGKHYAQGGQWYNFTWDVNQVEWFSSAGQDDDNYFNVSTEEAIQQGREDYIQCLPQQGLDVRINLWSMFGPNMTAGLDEIDTVEVIIDNFVYVPLEHADLLAEGEVCSRDCQCSNALQCEKGTSVCSASNNETGDPNIFD